MEHWRLLGTLTPYSIEYHNINTVMDVWAFINTDASYSHETSEGGYGIWIRSGEKVIKRAGKFNDKLTGSYEAEIKAVINAVHIVANTPNNNIKKVVIVCDNIRVIQNINAKSCLNPKYVDLYNMLFNLLKNFQKVEARHVKGHAKKINDPQTAINQWCDKVASVAVRYNITPKN